jgi:hypothetical protein
MSGKKADSKIVIPKVIIPKIIVPNYSLCPTCPEIKKKIDRIDSALLGEDGTGLKGGISFEISQLKGAEKVTSSWTSLGKPVLIAVASSVLTFIITYALVNRW